MRFVPIIAVLLASVGSGALAQAGPSDLNGRVTKLEKEVRAVQRKVFPGANPTYFDAEIAPAETPAAAPGTPASSPLNDLTGRVDALERQLTTLTAQSEQDGFQIHQLQEQFNRFKADAEFRLNTLEGKPNSAGGSPVAAPVTAAPTPAPAPRPAAAPVKPVAGPAPAPARPTASPSPADAAAAANDPAEADYLAAYQFVRDSKYPEAETALKAYVAKYPKGKRASYAQHWLGRSYLADGKPASAAEAFLANYTTMPRGDRAPDSLYWLGQSLMKLNKPTEACRVYGELLDVYGAKMSAAFKDQAAKARVAANCGK
jgi:tol-pal system protein YbgF